MTTISTASKPTRHARAASRRRFALLGAGGRATAFLMPLVAEHRDFAELVGLCDRDAGHIEVHQRRMQEVGGPPVPAYAAEQLPQMIAEQRPDAVIICLPDYLHAQAAQRVMELGCDVVVEKPLAIDAAGCEAVIDTARRTGRDVRVTFNCRYLPWAGEVYRLLRQGMVGEVISAQIDWMLDARKGVTYFARWHAEKARSGGLLVHKATHHLDLVNWWLDAVPDQVFALGRRAFFGYDNRHKHGIGAAGPVSDHYLDEDNRGDPFAPQPQTLEHARAMLPKPGDADGYRPDRSVWRREGLDIEDSMSVLVKYRTGPSLTYNLHAFLPRAGAMIAVNGTRGRIEVHIEQHGRVIPTGPVEVPAMPAGATPVQWQSRIIVHPLFGQAWEMPLPISDGGHDGSDPVLMASLFRGEHDDKMGRCAGAGQGAASAIIGIAANQSIATSAAVCVDELCPSLRRARFLHELP